MVLDIFLNIVSLLDELHYKSNSRRSLMNNLQKIVNTNILFNLSIVMLVSYFF